MAQQAAISIIFPRWKVSAFNTCVNISTSKDVGKGQVIGGIYHDLPTRQRLFPESRWDEDFGGKKIKANIRIPLTF
jgi:hypothetical protein